MARAGARLAEILELMVVRFLRAPKGTDETHKTSPQENPKRLEYQYSTNPLGDV
jgi:hypothetical protein